MNSLIQDSQLNNNNDIPQQGTIPKKSKIFQKSYSFFIFYKIITFNDKKLSQIQKLSFRLKEQKNSKQDKYLENPPSKNDKTVNFIYTNIQNEDQLENSFLELKFHIVQNKTKIIFLGYESDLLRLIDKTSQFGIDIKQVPFAIYSPSLNDDLSIFLGWRQQLLGNLAQKSPDQLSILANQWISSPAQKIDVWQINFKVKQNGKISKLQYDSTNQNYFLKTYENLYDKKQYFMSHFSVGYHSKMFMQFESTKNIQESSFFNRMKFGFSGFKKFCCVGNQSMKSSTGIVNISFKDEKNTQMEIMKQFYDKNSLEGELVQDKKYKHNRKVLSIVLSNIDTYNGQKLAPTRMNDNKIELLSFESKTEHHKIGSIGGQIKLKFQTQNQVCIKIGDSCFVLQHPVQAIIKPFFKMKALINKETVGC